MLEKTQHCETITREQAKSAVVLEYTHICDIASKLSIVFCLLNAFLDLLKPIIETEMTCNYIYSETKSHWNEVKKYAAAKGQIPEGAVTEILYQEASLYNLDKVSVCCCLYAALVNANCVLEQYSGSRRKVGRTCIRSDIQSSLYGRESGEYS